MRRTLAILAASLVVFDSVWLLNRADPLEPDYYLDLDSSEWWFADEGHHIEDATKLPAWDGRRWTLGGQILAGIEEEVGKRPLQSDYRCVFEYRLQPNTTYGHFLSAQRQAEDAGSSIMILTAEVDEKWIPRAGGSSWFLLNSVTQRPQCAEIPAKL